MAKVILHPRKAKPFFGRHPWVLDTAVASVVGAPADGDLVELHTDTGRFIAWGLYNSQSRIRVRLYSWNVEETPDAAFWRKRLQAAVRLREQIGVSAPEGAARLVFSEGDALSGLIVDRYRDYLVVQPTALAMARRLGEIVPALVELASPRGIVVRVEGNAARAEGLDIVEGPYWGEAPTGPVEILDGGVRYQVDLLGGQKTGFYLDQRENRLAAARYLRGGRVLDMFCYSGGFGLAAAQAGATEVLGIDSSKRAVAMAEANASLNGLQNLRFETGDCFTILEEMTKAGQIFDGVVLDPPKFAKKRRTLDEALRAYHWLNRLGVALTVPGGILVTCSCSGNVTREDFMEMLLGVAQQSKREIQILEQRGAAADHPVAITCRESDYLKCVICRVM